MHKKLFLYLFISLNLLISACVHSSESNESQKGLGLEMISSGGFAEGLGQFAGAEWITDSDALKSMVAKLGRPVLTSRQKVLPQINFTRYGVLLVWMGQKPTGGYGIELLPGKSYIRGRTAFVAVRWIEPAQGVIVSQVITHPYLMIRMNKGDYQRIAVIDQHGRSRMEIRLN